MILTLWIVLISLSIVFLFLGYTYNTSVSDVLLVVGWGFIFILGAVMTFGSVNQIVGNHDIITYDYDGLGRINATYITSIDSYEAFTNENSSQNFLNNIANQKTFGFFIMIIGLVGSVTFWFDVKRRNGLDGDEEDE